MSSSLFLLSLFLFLFFFPLTQCDLPTITTIENTHKLDASIPTYSGLPDSEMVVTTIADYSQGDTYAIRKMDNLYEHYGTHLDAPYHFGGPGKRYVDQIPSGDLIGELCVVDVREKVRVNANYAVTLSDLTKYENEHGTIPKGAIVMMLSGWGQRWANTTLYRNADSVGVMHFPGWSSAAILHLINDRSVKGVGVDTLSIDIGSSQTFDAHHVLGRANTWGLENVANLESVPVNGSVMVVAPMFLLNGTGAPARVYTIVVTPIPCPPPEKTTSYCQFLIVLIFIIILVGVLFCVYWFCLRKHTPTDERNMTLEG